MEDIGVGSSDLVEGGVEETYSLLASSETGSVDEANDSSPDRGAARGSIDLRGLTLCPDNVVVSQSRDVWVCASGCVEVSCGGELGARGEVALNSISLPRWSGGDVREASARCDEGSSGRGASDLRAASRAIWESSRGLGAIRRGEGCLVDSVLDLGSTNSGDPWASGGPVRESLWLGA